MRWNKTVKPKTLMLIAGEASGDLLAAELVEALCTKVLEVESEPTDDVQPLRTPLEPRFLGAGGPRMAAAGVELAFDMTQHSVIGLSDALKGYVKFRRLFRQLFKLALEHQPDAIICVDFSGFNRRFAHATKQYVRRHFSQFTPWNPKLIQYVSPQVWASRPGRVHQLAADYDLLLSIFPFEKEWYAQRVPKLRVEFVGHPILDRIQNSEIGIRSENSAPLVLLLPGSRADELRRHLPTMLGALKVIRAKKPACRAKIVLPTDALAQQAKAPAVPADVQIQVGGLREALAQADVAIAKSGTVTLECAFSGVPAVVLYKTSWPTYFAAKTMVNVKHVAMPNLLAGEGILPEFIQHAATAENIANAALMLLLDSGKRKQVKSKLANVVAALGGIGANQRAAEAIVRLLGE
jgi:lipid-A-disaccharide synthase